MATQSTLDLAVALARLAENLKAEDVVVLDVTGKHSLIDCFVVATARGTKHASSVAEEAYVYVKAQGEKPWHREVATDWVCCDFSDVVLHVFTPEAREFYDFESLWADADRVPLEPIPPSKATA